MRQDARSYVLAVLLHRGQPVLEALILTKLLPIEAFGQWSWASALYTGVISLMQGGVPAAMLRYSALYPGEGPVLLRYGIHRMLPWVGIGLVSLAGLGWSVPVPVCWLVWAYLPALPAFLLAEVCRTYLRGRYENGRLLRWQVVSTGIWLLLLLTLTLWKGLWGAAVTRLLQPLWLLGPIFPLLRQALRASLQRFEGFQRFGMHSLWGNLALEGIFFLPAWLIGWRSESPALIAYWRWATLLPLNLRSLFAQVVIYLYPAWVRTTQDLWLMYKRQRMWLWMLAGAGAGSLAIWGLLWEIFPGEAYLPTLPYYFMAIGAGLLWSTEALLLPNLLSARGHIRAYSWSYAGAFLVALSFYGLAGNQLLGYIGSLGASAVTASVLAGWAIRRLPHPSRVS